MSEHQDMFMDGDDPELDAWLKTADQAVLSSLESGMDLSHGLAAITGQEAAAVEDAHSGPTADEPTGWPYDRHGRTQRRKRQRMEGADSSTFHFGDRVTIHGGSDNIGIVSGQSGPAPADGIQMHHALQELIRLLQELRSQVSPPLDQVIDEALPYLSADASVPLQGRRRALIAVMGITATMGAVGQPTFEVIRVILDLLNDE
ncbi:hypothetical protein OHA37_39280 [Streptomyces sp. NBC_00335]|uniref:hypothetical protein n=1 Tax=unclassified Streptomyces TaxID=2593676 RepID=UPI002251C326|nr:MULTISPECIES: hypothetical protein [unclassified Streptomyces]MCX5409873.1 hypothetical protein [Streptomyces sp. NBC_00086]